MADTRLAEVCEAAFARHETFAPRFGWLRKGFLAVSEDPEAFLKDDAPVTLGVGKNMVSAIRYWSKAFKLTVELARSNSSRANIAVPTWEAEWLLSEKGADPYLEDPASLWLLHWWLLSPSPYGLCSAPTWWIAFNELPIGRFTDSELAELVIRKVSMAGWDSPAKASVDKDIDCLTKMYAPRKAQKGGSPGSFEDLLDCPFRELGLLEGVPGDGSRKHGDQWRFSNTASASLPRQVIAYACLDYVSRHSSAAGVASLARLANEPGAPGRVFKLREPEIAAALEEVAGEHGIITVADTVGTRSLISKGAPQSAAWEILDAYYGRARDRVATRDKWNSDHPDLSAELARRERKTEQLILGTGKGA